MPNYKLVYFNGMARAETIRYIFSLAGEKFEDKRYEMEEWPAIKPTMPTFQLPILEIDGMQFTQSKAIIMYLARKYGYLSNDEIEVLCIDMVIDTVDDIVPPWDKIYYARNEAEKAKYAKEFREVVVPLIYTRLERLRDLKHMNAGDYFVGNKMTAADLHFVSMVEFTEFYFPNSLEKFPKLKAIFDRVVANHAIAKWRETRPQTPW